MAGQETDSSGYSFTAIARYTASGALDSTFGSGGTMTTDLSGSASANSFAQGLLIDLMARSKLPAITMVAQTLDDFFLARYVANNAPAAANALAAHELRLTKAKRIIRAIRSRLSSAGWAGFPMPSGLTTRPRLPSRLPTIAMGPGNIRPTAVQVGCQSHRASAIRMRFI